MNYGFDFPKEACIVLIVVDLMYNKLVIHVSISVFFFDKKIMDCLGRGVKSVLLKRNSFKPSIDRFVNKIN